jgi:hypothetical protein
MIYNHDGKNSAVENMIESAMTLSELEWAHNFHAQQKTSDKNSPFGWPEKILVSEKDQLIYFKIDQSQKYFIDSIIYEKGSKLSTKPSMNDTVHKELIELGYGFGNNLDCRAKINVNDVVDNSSSEYTFWKNEDHTSKFAGAVLVRMLHFGSPKLNSNTQKEHHSFKKKQSFLNNGQIRKLAKLFPSYEIGY